MPRRGLTLQQKVRATAAGCVIGGLVVAGLIFHDPLRSVLLAAALVCATAYVAQTEAERRHG